MANVLIEIDGELHPLDKCHWVFYEACGCPFICMYASTATEPEAWNQAFDYAKERRATQKRGVRAELVSNEKCREVVLPQMSTSYVCPHKGS